MTRVSDARTDCCGEDSCDDRLAARVFGSLGLASVNVRAAFAHDFSRRRTAGWWANAESDGCRAMAAELAAIRAVPEVSLSEALSDPIVRTLMAADRVDRAELEQSLEELARKLARRHAGGTAGVG